MKNEGLSHTKRRSSQAYAEINKIEGSLTSPPHKMVIDLVLRRNL